MATSCIYTVIIITVIIIIIIIIIITIDDKETGAPGFNQ